MRTLTGLALVLLPALSVADPATPAPDAFTRRGVVTAGTDLRAGPDASAPSRGTVAAGTEIAVAADVVHGFRRVQLPTGETGHVVASAVKLDETAADVQAAAAGAAGGLEPLPPPVSSSSFAVRVGLAIPRSGDISGFNNGLALAGVYSGRGFEHVGYDVMVGMYQLSYSGTSGVLRIIPVMGAVRGIVTFGNIMAYGLAGGGAGIVSAFGSQSASATPFLMQVGAGAALPLSQRSSMDVEVRYLAGNAKLFQTIVAMDTMLLVAGVSFR